MNWQVRIHSPIAIKSRLGSTFIEIPPISPVVTEYQVHRLTCEVCGASTYGTWPHGVPTGMIGPRAQAIVSLCTGAYRLSKRTTQQVLHDLFGLSLSVGTISNPEASTTKVLEAPVDQARAYVQEQARAHLNETGWRQGGKRAWLWVAAATWVWSWPDESGHIWEEILPH
ncbi:IS66 family transposase, partial [Candidatus Entotheonella palauensis]